MDDTKSDKTYKWLEKAEGDNLGTRCEYLAVTRRKDGTFGILLTTEDAVMAYYRIANTAILDSIIGSLAECRAELETKTSSTLA